MTDEVPAASPAAPRVAGTPGIPLVSVVIAAYNAAGYVAETCHSVLRQTHSALELIIVDDGSTDGTGDIVRRIGEADARVHLVRQENLGVAAARNAGIAAASGEFIAPLDADDVWDPRKIARQVARLQEAGAETGFAYCWWAWIDVDGRILDRSPSWQIEGRALEQLLEINFIGNASVPLFRRSCVQEAGGYDVTLRERGCGGCEDWDLAVRVAERHAVAVVPAVLVGYRRRADAMSTELETMWRSRSAVAAALTARCPSVSTTALERSAGQFALYLAGVAFWSGRYLEAIRWGLRTRPLTLGLRVLPYVIRTFVRRVMRPPVPAVPGTRDGEMFSDLDSPDPHIPYDEIYARRWRRAGRSGQ